MIKLLSNAERQKQRIEKFKNEGKYEDFKKKKAETRRLSCQKQENMPEKESEIARLKKRLEMQKYRQSMKEISVQGATLTCVNALGSKISEAKATKQVSKALLEN